MASSKYGRLFTEADIAKLMRCSGAVPDSESDEELLGVVRSGIEVLDAVDSPTFPADEPLFLLRAQDRYAPWGAQHYVDGLAENLDDVDDPRRWSSRDVSREQFDKAHEAWQEMLLWQRAHPDRVKAPD